MAVDLRNPGSAEIIASLIESADVVTHNMRENAAKRLGIDEEAVRAINPAAVYAHSSSYGGHGPWSEFGAFDPAACALSGWEQHISGPGNRPTWLRNSAMDSQAGLSLFLASMIALYQRATTGHSSPARTSLLGVAAMSSSETVVLADGGVTPFSAIDAHQTGISPYYRIYEACDGWVAVAAVREPQRRALHEALGEACVSGFPSLIAELPAAEVLARLADAGVPAELVVTDGRDAFFDREIQLQTGLVASYSTKDYGWFEHPAGFWSDAAGTIGSARPIPSIGEHTTEILRELGYSDQDIQRLQDDGVVSIEAAPPPSNMTVNRLTRSLATRVD
ncbi:acyl-CoA transferase [Mycobacterium avium subsp. hominissuis 10-5606]|nr:acyl-CoA transferase [Mycobacterium avium subsp. hominissuis 10-5606]